MTHMSQVMSAQILDAYMQDWGKCNHIDTFSPSIQSKAMEKNPMCDLEGCNQSDQMLLKVNSLSSQNHTCNCTFAFKNPGLCAAAPWEGLGAASDKEKAPMSKFRLLPLKSAVLETLWCRLIIASRWSASWLSRYSWGAARAQEKVINHQWPAGKELMWIISKRRRMAMAVLIAKDICGVIWG